MLGTKFRWRKAIYFCILFNTCSFTTTAQPATPKFQAFQPISIANSSQAAGFTPGRANPLAPHDPYKEQNLRMMQQGGMTLPGPSMSKRQQQAELRTLLPEEYQPTSREAINAIAQPFLNSFHQLLQLNPDSFSITKAVYLVESAYYDKPYSFQEFSRAMQQRAMVVQEILKQEGLDNKNNLALNYAIQRLFRKPTTLYNAKTNRSITIDKLRYDFDDYLGEKEWTKMFVTKVLETNSGQCRSFPLLYLCLAEQVGAKAYLSLSPNHSFIQFFDKKGRQYNFETTNGNLVSIAWLMQSTNVNATAYKNRTYLDSLSSRKLFAQCLTDLLQSYEVKINGFDPVSEQMINKILELDPTNITALMIKANHATYKFRYEASLLGNPPEEMISRYASLQKAYESAQYWQERVLHSGFQEMPKEAYERWLASIEVERKREINRQEQEAMKKEVEQLRKQKSTLYNKPKD
ncbi:MAG: hypothetical protein QM664_05995 [Flavihumibacter sp.]